MISVALGVGCVPSEGPSSNDVLPPEDTGVYAPADPWEFDDTGGAAFPDDAPANVLTLHAWGSASLAPAGGPYETLTGTLRVREYLDGARPPEEDTDDTDDTDDGVWDTDDTDAPEPEPEPEPVDTGLEPIELACDLTWGLDGVVHEGTSCDGCAFAFRVTFALVEGDPSGCREPRMPVDGGAWTLAYHPSGVLARDYGDAGLWLSWYDAVLEDDVLRLSYELDLGVSVEEEDE